MPEKASQALILNRCGPLRTTSIIVQIRTRSTTQSQPEKLELCQSKDRYELRSSRMTLLIRNGRDRAFDQQRPCSYTQLHSPTPTMNEQTIKWCLPSIVTSMCTLPFSHLIVSRLVHLEYVQAFVPINRLKVNKESILSSTVQRTSE